MAKKPPKPQDPSPSIEIFRPPKPNRSSPSKIQTLWTAKIGDRATTQHSLPPFLARGASPFPDLGLTLPSSFPSLRKTVSEATLLIITSLKELSTGLMVDRWCRGVIEESRERSLPAGAQFSPPTTNKISVAVANRDSERRGLFQSSGDFSLVRAKFMLNGLMCMSCTRMQVPKSIGLIIFNYNCLLLMVVSLRCVPIDLVVFVCMFFIASVFLLAYKSTASLLQYSPHSNPPLCVLPLSLHMSCPESNNPNSSHGHPHNLNPLPSPGDAPQWMSQDLLDEGRTRTPDNLGSTHSCSYSNTVKFGVGGHCSGTDPSSIQRAGLRESKASIHQENPPLVISHDNVPCPESFDFGGPSLPPPSEELEELLALCLTGRIWGEFVPLPTVISKTRADWKGAKGQVDYIDLGNGWTFSGGPRN